MTQREALHALVDDLPEEALSAAEGALATIRERTALKLVDDEPVDDDFDGELTIARDEAERGEGISTAELLRRLGAA